MSLGLTCHLYADAGSNSENFPDDGQGACGSLNLLYKSYVSDSRIFVCPEDSAQPSTNGLKPWDGITKTLTKQMTSYGYGRGHIPGNEYAVILSDMGAAAGPGKSSENHGAGHGQNVADCTGAGRYLENTVIKLNGRPDDDIFQDDTKDGKLKPCDDSWIRND